MDNNVGGMKSLLEALSKSTPVPVVFSSTCAVYGNPPQIPVDENAPIAPMSPYGESKVLCEEELNKYCNQTSKPAFALRYFNACGADSDGGIGESHFPTQRLISSIFYAINADKTFTMHGTDFDTPDGTCVRDYIHVTDLAEAHVLAAKLLSDKVGFDVVNLGTGSGTSNREILDAVEKTLKNPVKHEFGPRRDGDPARLFADCTKANSVLNFTAKHSDINNVIGTASAWHIENPKGYQ
jgi:UDP-glucose-4-epimerase GalE